MSEQVDLQAMEQEAYRAWWSDGIVDIYVGLSLLWIGAMWTWVNDLSGIAGVLPAILVAPVLAAHRRFVEARLGHVEWRPARRGWERRNQLALLAAGAGLFLLGVAVWVLVSANGGGGLRLAPGVLAWLLALMAIGLAFLLDARRMLLYAVVLTASGAVVVLLEAKPGWPMLACGAVATVVGLVMLRRFVERYPIIDPA
jgi:hypothetical protein